MMPESPSSAEVPVSGVYSDYAPAARSHVDDLPSRTVRYPENAGRSSLSYPASTFRYRYIKRAADILLVIASIPVVIPVVVLIGLIVKLTSPGPVFFSHRRLCKSGAFFSMWKFRTMRVNSSEVLEAHLAEHPALRAEWNHSRKLRDDPRVTTLGRFLRRYSLDEIPQIWNVLTGSMSLVGPRPIVAAEVENYGDQFAYYTRVKPGVTGQWQVSGRSTLSYDARVEIDRDYVLHWSLRRDLWILLRTFPSVVNRDGAY